MDCCEQRKSLQEVVSVGSQCIQVVTLHKDLNATCLVRQFKHESITGGSQQMPRRTAPHLEQHSSVSRAEHRTQALLLGSILHDIALQFINASVCKYQSEDLSHVLGEPQE